MPQSPLLLYGTFQWWQWEDRASSVPACGAYNSQPSLDLPPLLATSFREQGICCAIGADVPPSFGERCLCSGMSCTVVI